MTGGLRRLTRDRARVDHDDIRVVSPDAADMEAPSDQLLGHGIRLRLVQAAAEGGERDARQRIPTCRRNYPMSP